MKGVSGRESRSFSRMGGGIDLGRAGAACIPQGVSMFEGEATETSEVGSMNDSIMRDRAWRKTSLHLRNKTPLGEPSRAAEVRCAS